VGILSNRTLFSPELETDHPLTIIPDLDVTDKNPVKYIPHQGAISIRKHSEAYKILADPVPGAVEFRVYGSLSPTRRENLIRAGLKHPEYTFYPQWITEVAVYYFWMTWVDAVGHETYYTEVPATLAGSAEEALLRNPITPTEGLINSASAELLNRELLKDLSYIRKADRLQLELNGEPALLYIRRHAEDQPWGVPCTCTFDEDMLDPEEDSDFQGSANCKFCFGTGIFGGYYPAIPIEIRYMDAPEKVFKPSKRGFELQHAFNTYMLYSPAVRMEDIVVRMKDGTRYHVAKTRETSVRAVNLSQAFDLTQIPKNDIRMEITNESIGRALEKVKFPDYFVEGYRTFG